VTTPGTLVITPHARELARIAGGHATTSRIRDRRRARPRHRAVVVAKGPATLVVDEDGARAG
jgi:NAD(P)H-hydrate repair Nnr-like enzyme with NAD(P)H-hydrate dehydratase domain